MDLDDFRMVLDTAGVDVWAFIDAAIAVASEDCGQELRRRRDTIVERLYSATSAPPRCRNCDADRPRPNGHAVSAARVEKEPSPEVKRRSTPTPPSAEIEDDGADPFGGLFDDDQKKILEIRERLEDPEQPDDALVEMLQILADMDITFSALQETDIGRHVNRLRKHSSNEVRKLVKHLVRKWKEIVDEWVSLNQPGEMGSSALMDGDSPQQKILHQNGHHQVPESAYSPNPHNGSSGSEKNHSEQERSLKAAPRKEAPTKPSQPAPVYASNQNRQREQREQRENNFDSDRLASARKRLQANYKEAENAKKQRTIQVMDIHEIPKPRNTFFPKSKGSGSQGRHW